MLQMNLAKKKVHFTLICVMGKSWFEYGLVIHRTMGDFTITGDVQLQIPLELDIPCIGTSWYIFHSHPIIGYVYFTILISLCIYLYVSIYVYIHVCKYVYVYTHICIHTYICIHIYVCVYVYMYIYIYIQSSPEILIDIPLGRSKLACACAPPHQSMYGIFSQEVIHQLAEDLFRQHGNTSRLW